MANDRVKVAWRNIHSNEEGFVKFFCLSENHIVSCGDIKDAKSYTRQRAQEFIDRLQNAGYETQNEFSFC